MTNNIEQKYRKGLEYIRDNRVGLTEQYEPDVNIALEVSEIRIEVIGHDQDVIKLIDRTRNQATLNMILYTTIEKALSNLEALEVVR